MAEPVETSVKIRGKFVDKRHLYKGRDGHWYLTYSGGEVSGESTKMLLERGWIATPAHWPANMEYYEITDSGSMSLRTEADPEFTQNPTTPARTRP